MSTGMLIFLFLMGIGALKLLSAGRSATAPKVSAAVLMALILTLLAMTAITMEPVIFCKGEGMGGNCGEGLMATFPLALLLSPLIYYVCRRIVSTVF